MSVSYNDLTHLTPTEVEIFYQRYLTESATVLVKDYNLAPKVRNRLFGIIPDVILDSGCKLCGGELTISRLRKAGYQLNNKNHMEKVSGCVACKHIHIVNSYTMDVQSLEGCHCAKCKENRQLNLQKEQEKKKAKEVGKDDRIIKKFTLERRYIPFAEDDETYNLADVVTLMALIFARWNNEEGNDSADYIAPINDNPIVVFPEQNMSNTHPLVQCINKELIYFDFNHTYAKDFIEKEDGIFSYYPLNLSFQANFKNIADKNLSIQETYEWLSRKFTDGYWYSRWNSQLLDVWIELGVAECIEYAKLKAEEYRFGFNSETKISEIIRDLLNEHSVADCFYFISSSYLSAGAFYQSNKAKNRMHAENTVPGKIMSLAGSGRRVDWHRPHDLPRSAFSQMLFDVMLNTKQDAGFYLCPGKSYQDLLNKIQVEWPVVEDSAKLTFNLTGYGFNEFMAYHRGVEIENSTDSVNTQLAHLLLIADHFGLKKAAQALGNSNMLEECDILYMESLAATIASENEF